MKTTENSLHRLVNLKPKWNIFSCRTVWDSGNNPHFVHFLWSAVQPLARIKFNERDISLTLRPMKQLN